MPSTRHRSRILLGPRLLGLIGVVTLLAACGGTPTPTPVALGSPASSAAASAPSAQTPPASPDASADASASPSGGPSESPSPRGSATPVPNPSPSPRPGSADACSGTAENRDFYTALADSVAWDVYCPVLPAGWFVDSGANSGSYRLANGGQLSITYRGPGGARLVIREGNYCTSLPDCPPSGTDTGSAHFGERDARLLDVGSGSWLVLAASPGVDVRWQATGVGMDGPSLEAYTAAFARVDR